MTIEQELKAKPNISHGKPSTYNNHKCRGPLCQAAWAEYMKPRVRKWRDKQKGAN